MDTKLLDAIRIIMRQELKPINARLNKLELEVVNLKVSIDAGFRQVNTRLKEHDHRFLELENRMDILLEGWTIQKVHREELDGHEARITAVEHRIPAIS